jgi:hypothetical protein
MAARELQVRRNGQHRDPGMGLRVVGLRQRDEERGVRTALGQLRGGGREDAGSGAEQPVVGQRQHRSGPGERDARGGLVAHPGDRPQGAQRVHRCRDLRGQQPDQVDRLGGRRGGAFGDHAEQVQVPAVRREQSYAEALVEARREEVLTPQRDLLRRHGEVGHPSRAWAVLRAGQFDVLEERRTVAVLVGGVVEPVPAQRHVDALAGGQQSDRADLEGDHPLHLGVQGPSSLREPTGRRRDAGDLGQDLHGIRRQLTRTSTRR